MYGSKDFVQSFLCLLHQQGSMHPCMVFQFVRLGSEGSSKKFPVQFLPIQYLLDVPGEFLPDASLRDTALSQNPTFCSKSTNYLQRRTAAEAVYLYTLQNYDQRPKCHRDCLATIFQVPFEHSQLLQTFSQLSFFF